MTMRALGGLFWVCLLVVASGQKLHESCDYWAYVDTQCVINYKFMWTMCRESCLEQARVGIYSTPPTKEGERPITEAQCEMWANDGECTRNLGFIQTHCPKQCGYGLAWNIWVRNTLEMESMLNVDDVTKEVNQIATPMLPEAIGHLNTHLRHELRAGMNDNVRHNKRQYIRDYLASLRDDISSSGDKGKGKGEGNKKERLDIETVEQAIDMEALEVLPNSLAKAEIEGERDDDTSSTADHLEVGWDLLDVAGDIADRLSMYVEQGQTYNVSAHGLSLDAPQPLHGMYGLYEATLYSLRVFRMCIHLLTKGLNQQQEQQPSQEQDSDLQSIRQELYRSLLAAKEEFILAENHVILTINNAKYDFDPLARHMYAIVRMLREKRGVVEEILLQGEETGALVTYTPTSNLLNVTRATHALREIFHFDEKNEVPVVDIEAIPSPVSAPQPSINEEGGDTDTRTVILNTGIIMPILAFGTWKLEKELCQRAVLQAIKAGYRHIDSAQAYGNEHCTGNAIVAALRTVPGLKREHLFLATKLSDEGASGGYSATRALVEQQLQDLGVDYFDLYYLHSPFRSEEKLEGTLVALFEFILEGKINCLGLSNFDAGALEAFYAPDGSFVKAANVVATLPGIRQDRLTYFRPVVLQNKLDVYHVGRQFDNQGSVSIATTAHTYKLFVMGYSPFSGYPFALMPIRDPLLRVVTNEYNNALRASSAGAGALVSTKHSRALQEVRVLDEAAILVKYHVQHDKAGIILRSSNLSHLQACLAGIGSSFPPLNAHHEDLLSIVPDLISNPYLKSVHYTEG